MNIRNIKEATALLVGMAIVVTAISMIVSMSEHNIFGSVYSLILG